jgi:hypothetical protein
MVAYTYKARTWEVDAGGKLVWGQSELQWDHTSKKKKKEILPTDHLWTRIAASINSFVGF